MNILSQQGKSNCKKHHHYNSTCLRCAEGNIEELQSRLAAKDDLLKETMGIIELLMLGYDLCGMNPNGDRDHKKVVDFLAKIREAGKV